jgi:tetratricopeptide (TPR) repeat protein
MSTVSPDDAASDLAELRQAALNDPSNGVLRYLLAAELADLQDYDGAVLEFAAAIALDPSLHIARLQLGLLHLTLARTDQTLTVLAPLEALADDQPLKYFKRGLEALIHDDFPTCLQMLQQGIDLNTVNPALNRDMALIIERVRQALNGPEALTGKEAVRTDFSLYGVTKH